MPRARTSSGGSAVIDEPRHAQLPPAPKRAERAEVVAPKDRLAPSAPREQLNPDKVGSREERQPPARPISRSAPNPAPDYPKPVAREVPSYRAPAVQKKPDTSSITIPALDGNAKKAVLDVIWAAATVEAGHERGGKEARAQWRNGVRQQLYEALFGKELEIKDPKAAISQNVIEQINMGLRQLFAQQLATMQLPSFLNYDLKQSEPR